MAACTGSERPAGRVGWVPPGEEGVALIAAARPDRHRAVRYLDDRQAEEYGQVGLPGLHLEYVQVTADATDAAPLAASFGPVRAAALFRRNAAADPAWGSLGRVAKPGGGGLLYRPYRLGSGNCFAFAGDLGRARDGAPAAQAEILLGYGCADDAALLGPARIEAVLGGIGSWPAAGPSSSAGPAGVRSLLPAESAAPVPRGDPEAAVGLVAFTLRLVHAYALADADEAW